MKKGHLPGAVLALFAGLAAAATPQDRASGESVSYVFASELGSGIYDLRGRSLQVYRVTPKRQLREASPERPGVRVVVPATIGFFDFSPFDIPGSGLPTRIDSFSITPGIELDFLLRDDWVITPWLRAGFSIAEGGVDGWLYGAGLGLERRSEVGQSSYRRRHELAVAGVAFTGQVPDDRFIRLRQAGELRRGTGLRWSGQELEWGAYGLFDILLDPPTAPLAGGVGEPLRLELGMMLGSRPGPRIRRLPLPRIGLGYRFAGELSGWHIALGAPF